eukprot:UN22836
MVQCIQPKIWDYHKDWSKPLIQGLQKFPELTLEWLETWERLQIGIQDMIFLEGEEEQKLRTNSKPILDVDAVQKERLKQHEESQRNIFQSFEIKSIMKSVDFVNIMDTEEDVKKCSVYRSPFNNLVCSELLAAAVSCNKKNNIKIAANPYLCDVTQVLWDDLKPYFYALAGTYFLLFVFLVLFTLRMFDHS